MPVGGLYGTLYGADRYAGSSATGALADRLGLTLIQVVDELQTAGVAAGIFTGQQVMMSLLDEPFAKAGFPQFVVTPKGFNRIGEQLNGGGRYTTGMDGQFSVMVWVRNATDATYEDANRLTSQTRGAYQIVNTVIDILDEYFPLNPADGSLLTEEGLKVVSIEEPRRGTKPHAAEGKSPEIAGIKVVFEARLALNLSGTV